MNKKPFVFCAILSVFLVGCSNNKADSLDSSSSSNQTSSSAVSEASSSSSQPSSATTGESSLDRSLSSQPSSEQSTQTSSDRSSSEKTSTAESSASAQTVPDYVLHGQFGGQSGWTDKAMQKNPSSSSEYMIQGITLYRNDVFKIHMDSNTWYGYSDLKASVPSGLVGKGASDDNIKVLTDGIYDIYSSFNFSDGGHIYLAKVDDIETSSSQAGGVTGVTLNRSGVYLYVGGRFYLEATVSPSSAPNQNVTWSSGNSQVAVVSQTGWVAGVGVGKTTITATSVDGGKIATCMVFVGETEVPPYYLYGTIGGRTIDTNDYEFAAIPDTGSRYIIPDVRLLAGDEIYIYNPDRQRPLKDDQGRDYVLHVTESMYVDIYLDILSATKNYLRLSAK